MYSPDVSRVDTPRSTSISQMEGGSRRSFSSRLLSDRLSGASGREPWRKLAFALCASMDNLSRARLGPLPMRRLSSCRSNAVMRIQGLLVLVAISAVACGERSSVSPTPVPTAISLSIDGSASFSLRGETSQLKALVTLSDRRVEDATATVSWSSSNVSVVTVSPLGVVTARGDGRAMVTATLNAIVATKPVLVDLPTQ